ncbi:SulP family inorganic anion transporter [Phenylobacterium sp. LH3H17]|uniref:SulP family inorganic anion transporter n=1 Tax=Phenylobacterium sp. LH3H17 TaxID=2903901 RepID=UPI0020C949DD|nr:SulP family inorganic anion transporter [Phenylobacterium sp. LH3H17]UTP41069.1 SulP family inorganic anion transporter [Phenylobacterium sp. LH3H17]
MSHDWRLFIPKTVTVLRQGYGLSPFRGDVVAGLTVAIVAMPLAMALAIASGTTPERGLITAVVAGFLISLLGGSRFQIGGPTGAFVVVVYGVIAKHGYDGLLIATTIAGVILIAAGLLRIGTLIKYIPDPVTTGFTTGIATIILVSQLKDIFGLSIERVPADFLPKLQALWAARASLSLPTLALAVACFAAIMVLRRLAPKVPGFLVVTVAAAVIVSLLALPVETIGTRFGGVSSTLPAPSLDFWSWTKARDVLPSAFTIALLAGVESLLSAVVADQMTGRRHRSNIELVAQGIANISSAAFGGLPATGAIARTATNIRAGAHSPVAGMLHAAFLLLFMLLLSPLARFVPLAALAAILVVVAINMAELQRFRLLLGTSNGDRAVLLLTFGLTVVVDLTLAIEVGMVLAAFVFMHRMSQLSTVEGGGPRLIDGDRDDFSRADEPAYEPHEGLPHDTAVITFRGPMFFGSTSVLKDALDQIGGRSRRYILRFEEVPLVDPTGAAALSSFLHRAIRDGAEIIVCGASDSVRANLLRTVEADVLERVGFVPDFAAARAATAAVA